MVFIKRSIQRGRYRFDLFFMTSTFFHETQIPTTKLTTKLIPAMAELSQCVPHSAVLAAVIINHTCCYWLKWRFEETSLVRALNFRDWRIFRGC